MQKSVTSAPHLARTAGSAADSHDVALWCLVEPVQMACGRVRPSSVDREPPLAAVLADPIVRRLMESDGVRMRALQALIIRTRTALKTGTPVSLS
jgi:hypothetical protein